MVTVAVKAAIAVMVTAEEKGIEITASITAKEAVPRDSLFILS